jgi:hypothetical protein
MLRDFVFAYGRIIASKVSGRLNSILLNIAGIGNGLDETSGEGSTDEPFYGQIGIVARPRPAVSSTSATGLNPEGYAEVICARAGDGLTPVASRDLRLNALVNPAVGEVDLVQYGGGYISLATNADGQGTTMVLYTPKLTAGGAIQKSHTLTMNTAAADLSISIVHADGNRIDLETAGVTVSGTGGPSPLPVAIAQPFQDWVVTTSSILSPLIAFANGLVPGTVSPAQIADLTAKTAAVSSSGASIKLSTQ